MRGFGIAIMRGFGIAIFLMLGACSSGDETTKLGDTSFTNAADGTATISNERGSISALEGDAAAATKFPDFAPQYPGSTVQNVLITNSERGKQTMAVLVTHDDVASVANFYREKFTAAGLTVKSAHVMEESAMVSAEGVGKKASITGGKQDGKSSFTLTFSGE